MGRIAKGWELLKESWAVLRQDKELMVFPILSSIANLLIIASFLLPFALIPQLRDTVFQAVDRRNQQDPAMRFVGYGIMFLFYFVTYFVVVFFNVALVSCAVIRFKGGNPTVGDGLNAAFSRLPQIVGWALVAATVGMILRLLEEKLSWLGQIVVALIGTAWSIATYFIVPVLAVENVGPVDAVKRSAKLLTKTWGESLVGNLSMGAINLVLALPGIAILIGGVALGVGTNNIWFALPLVALGIVYLVMLSIVTSTLQQIFLAGVYLYASEGQIPNQLSEDLVRDAFKQKKKK